MLGLMREAVASDGPLDSGNPWTAPLDSTFGRAGNGGDGVKRLPAASEATRRGRSILVSFRWRARTPAFFSIVRPGAHLEDVEERMRDGEAVDPRHGDRKLVVPRVV